MPNPRNHTWPVLQSIITLAGLRSLWIRPRACRWRRAAATPAPVRKTSPRSHRRARALHEQLATRILEHQCSPPFVRRQRYGANRPDGIQCVSQRVFVLQHPDHLGSRMLRSRHHDKRRARRHGRVYGLTAAAQDELTVFEKSLEPVVTRDSRPRSPSGPPLRPLARLECGTDETRSIHPTGDPVVDRIRGLSSSLGEPSSGGSAAVQESVVHRCSSILSTRCGALLTVVARDFQDRGCEERKWYG